MFNIVNEILNGDVGITTTHWLMNEWNYVQARVVEHVSGQEEIESCKLRVVKLNLLINRGIANLDDRDVQLFPSSQIGHLIDVVGIEGCGVRIS